MEGVRKTWKIKPFTRIKQSDRVYRRVKNKEATRKLDQESEGRILGLDLGEKRVGVAISDSLRLTVRGLTTLIGKTTEEILLFVENIVKEHNVLEIVLGHPLLMSGDEGDMAKMTRQFGENLKNRVPVPVILWDERLSSKQAERLLRGDKNRRKKEDIDRISACLILQSYLDSITD